MASRKPQSAGLLLFRGQATDLEVLLGHPGGPFWQNKDDGAWSIPKGLIGADEAPLSAARREFAEETGHNPEGATRRGTATGRQGRPGVGRRRRLGCRAHPQQHLRDGVAAAFRTPSDLSGNRPWGLVCRCRRATENPQGTGDFRQSIARGSGRGTRARNSGRNSMRTTRCVLAYPLNLSR